MNFIERLALCYIFLFLFDLWIDNAHGIIDAIIAGMSIIIMILLLINLFIED